MPSPCSPPQSSPPSKILPTASGSAGKPSTARRATASLSKRTAAIGYTSGNSFVYKAAANGKFYTYTVRCRDNTDRRYLSWYDDAGISGTYISAPRITGFTPSNGAVTIRWKTVRGISRYRVYLKSGSGWVKLANTTKPEFTHKSIKAGTLYTYAVRCVNKNGKAISGYYTDNNAFRYMDSPKIASVADGKITLGSVRYAAGYRIYRKIYGKGWKVIGDTATASYTDTTAAKNVPYAYTARCLDSAGHLTSWYLTENRYYCNGKLANGNITVSGQTLSFTNGVPRQKGYVTISGKMYYYNSKGVLQKNGIVGSAKEGYRYADKNGVINLKYTGVAVKGKNTWYFKNGKIDYKLRDAVTVGGVSYNVINGRAHRVTTAEERTLFRALKLANRVASRSLPKEKRLKILWDYIKGAYEEKNPRIPDYTGMDWPTIYADDLLVNGVGNCLSYGAEFAFLAKAIGYDNVYACHSGGHGWAEIDGLVYDPEWSMHHFTYNYYGLSYNTKTDQDYKGAIAANYAWMHIKICPKL